MEQLRRADLRNVFSSRVCVEDPGAPRGSSSACTTQVLGPQSAPLSPERCLHQAAHSPLAANLGPAPLQTLNALHGVLICSHYGCLLIYWTPTS